MFPFGALIGAGASLLGGFLNRESNEDARDQAQAHNEQQIALQREFAQSGLRWRAADAMAGYGATGIHPLTLLGANAPSYSPVNFVGGGNAAMGDAISTAGQGLGRAVDATADLDRRLGHASRLDALVTERAGLENELLKMRIASELAQLKQGAAPGLPTNRWLVDGQGSTARLVKDKPLERVAADPSAMYQEPGAIVDRGFARTPTGYQVVPSKDVKERIEDSFIQEFLWAWRNNVLPGLIAHDVPPRPPREGMDWSVSPFGHYREVPKSSMQFDPSLPYRRWYGR